MFALAALPLIAVPVPFPAPVTCSLSLIAAPVDRHCRCAGLSAHLKTGYHLSLMSCRKGKSKAKPKPGRYRCTDCGAVVKKKSDVCEPKKVTKKD